MKPAIKYYGGKNNMLKQILQYFPKFEDYHVYLEPFGGSAGVLLSQPLGHVEIYNDLYNNVYSLYKVISDKELFIKFKEKCDLAIYHEQVSCEYRDLLKNNDLDIIDRAFYYWYVNRSRHNGIGGFSTNCYIRRGMSKSTSDFLSCIDRLKEIHDRLSAVMILNRDALEVIKKFDAPNVFIYSDSPYHWSTRTSSRYPVDMDNDKQQEYLNLLLTLKSKVLISGYDCDAYKILENNGWNKITFDVKTTSGDFKKKTKQETLWKNY